MARLSQRKYSMFGFSRQSQNPTYFIQGRKFHISCSPHPPTLSSHLPPFLPSLTRPLSCFLILTTGAEAWGPQGWKYRALVRCLLHASLQVDNMQQLWHLPTDPRLGFPALSAELHGATGHRWHQTGNLCDNPENQNLDLQRRAERG